MPISEYAQANSQLGISTEDFGRLEPFCLTTLEKHEESRNVEALIAKAFLSWYFSVLTKYVLMTMARWKDGLKRQWN